MLAARHRRRSGGLVVREAIQGWRAWRLAGTRDASAVGLYPLAARGPVWPALVPMDARCTKRRHHRVPDDGCTCGLHATRLPGQLPWSRGPGVLGRVALWGRVIEHERGFRAEHGYPQRLRLLCGICCWLPGPALASGPAFVVRQRGGWMIPLCERHLELGRTVGYPAPRVLDAALVERAVLDTYGIDLLPLPAATPAPLPADGGGRPLPW